jgi:lysophospholipase L1-like esterase
MSSIKLLQKKIEIHIVFTLLQLFQVMAIALFLCYLCWEVYWYQKIGLFFIKWHTHLVFTFLLFGVFVLPFYLWHKGHKSETSQKWLMAAISALMVMVGTEAVLIVTGIKEEYSEQRMGFYQSPFMHDTLNYYHTFHKSDTGITQAPEFTLKIPYNSLGFSGQEWPLQKDTNKVRIVTLGDSFTEGDGAPVDSSYPALLQQMDFNGKQVEVLNAGVRGSDPAFGLKNLEDRLLKYKPDVVIQAISENDVLYDMCIRGGMERFVNDSVVVFNKPPFWEPIYAMSFTSRIFFNALGYDMKTPCGSIYNETFIQSQNKRLLEVLNRFETLAASNNFKLLFVFYPTKYEVFRGAYDFDFELASSHVNSLYNAEYVNLFPCYNSTFQTSSTQAQEYYWKLDGHHNAKGYKMMAECIAQALKPMLLADTLN